VTEGRGTAITRREPRDCALSFTSEGADGIGGTSSKANGSTFGDAGNPELVLGALVTQMPTPKASRRSGKPDRSRPRIRRSPRQGCVPLLEGRRSLRGHLPHAPP
jgi:hypothetical protein